MTHANMLKVHVPCLCKSSTFDESLVGDVVNIDANDYVLVFNGRQYFWVLVSEVHEDFIIGQVNNMIQGYTKYNLRDWVKIDKDMIESIKKVSLIYKKT